MTLKDDLGLVPRCLYFMFGSLLAVATIATAYHDWPLVEAHKSSAIGFLLINIIALPLSVLIILWAVIGRHREWRITAQDVRIRLLSLTSWQKTHHILPEEIEAVVLDSFAYEDRGHRTAHWLTVTLKSGKTVHSPKTFDKAAVDQAYAEVERLKREVPDVFPANTP